MFGCDKIQVLLRHIKLHYLDQVAAGIIKYRYSNRPNVGWGFGKLYTSIL